MIKYDHRLNLDVVIVYGTALKITSVCRFAKAMYSAVKDGKNVALTPSLRRPALAYQN